MKKIIAVVSALFLATSSVAYAGGYGGFHHGGFHGGFHRGGFPIGPAIGLGIVGAGIAAGTAYECYRMVQTFDDYGRPYYVRQWVC